MNVRLILSALINLQRGCSSSVSYVLILSLLQRELTNLLGLHPRIEMVRASCMALKSRPSAPSFVQQSFERFLGRFQSVQQDLEDRQQQLENGKQTISSLRAFIEKSLPAFRPSAHSLVWHQTHCVFLCACYSSRSQSIFRLVPGFTLVCKNSQLSHPLKWCY